MVAWVVILVKGVSEMVGYIRVYSRIHSDHYL